MYIPDLRSSDLVKDELPGGDSAIPTLIERETEEATEGAVDPELMINIVDLGLLYGVIVDEEVSVIPDMTSTSPTCLLTDRIKYNTKYTLDSLMSSVTINRVRLSSWILEMITEDGRERLRVIDYNL